MTCIPLGNGGVACMRGRQLTQTDLAAVEEFRQILHDQYAKEETVTDQTQPDPTPPVPAPTQPAGVDLAAAGVAGWYLILDQVAKKREELDGIEAQAQEQIKAVLGDNVDGLIDGKPVLRWLHVAASKRFNRKQLAKDHPDIEKQYTTYGEPGRRFELVKPKAVK
ncbi:MAG: hypothetical protein JWO98_2564 [Frankiales bacterium]|nr:hypothetical protein [Frankiales bacterium]